MFGLDPLDEAWRDARLAIAGNEFSPGTDVGWSSRKILKPHISIPTWLGRRRPDRRMPVYNFFNREQPPRGAPFSVRVERCRDWMGGTWTYDSHVGTDFACPVGTPVTAPAPGVVLRDLVELDHGGLKLFIDHGGGLVTTAGHLSRSHVRVGQTVERGEVIGLSGASGIEFLLFFPWVSPHVHLNTWLNGVPVDPYALDGEESLWRRRNDPVPHDGTTVPDDASFRPSVWDEDAIEANTAAIRDPQVLARVRSYDRVDQRAAELITMIVFRPGIFREIAPVHAEQGERRPLLDLPFRAEDTPGAALPGT